MFRSVPIMYFVICEETAYNVVSGVHKGPAELSNQLYFTWCSLEYTLLHLDMVSSQKDKRIKNKS